jgi:hypothetical protein
MRNLILSRRGGLPDAELWHPPERAKAIFVWTRISRARSVMPVVRRIEDPLESEASTKQSEERILRKPYPEDNLTEANAAG